MDHAEKRRRTGDLKTKVLVSAAVLLLIGVTDAFAHPRLLALFIVAYLALTVALWDLSSRVVEWRRVRAVPMVLDLAAISVVVWSTGGIESSWYLLYLFTILSAARYLGARGSLPVTALAVAGYAAACVTAGAGPQDVYPFAIRAIMLAAVALTAARPIRARERADEKLLNAIEDIDRAIETDAGMTRVMRMIMDAAMEITSSEMSAIRLADGTEDAATRVNEIADAGDVAAVALAVRRHYDAVTGSGRLLSLPRPGAEGPVQNRAEGWAARLVPLAIGDTCVGVLGVFSRRRLQYTQDDERRLKSLAHVTAMAQKNAMLAHNIAALAQTNATLYAASEARLQILYEVGERLKSGQRIEELFHNVVRLVSDHLGSEEAALFLPPGGETGMVQDPNGPLKKWAVAGPSKAVQEQLRTLQELYGDERSLSRRVFDGRTPILNNEVDPREPHAATYAALLPSGIIRHYLGAPLIVGDQVLGTIRVLNKRARDYAPAAGAAHLADKGFGDDDLKLLSAIATQVASAIRNAGFVEQHAYFRNVVDQSPDPIIVIDKSGWIQIFNQASERLWGVTEEEMRGTHVSALYETPELAKEIGDEVWAAAESGTGIKDRAASIRKPVEGGYENIPIRLAATGFLHRDGKLAGSIGIFTDEREVIRSIAAEKLKAVGRLAAIKGHDVKTDVATILVWSDTLTTSGIADPRIQRAGLAIQAAAERARAKLQDMLMAANPIPPRTELVSLRALLEQFLKGFEEEAAAQGIDFSVEYPAGEHLLLADAEQLRQVFTNLFGNSTDAIVIAAGRTPDPPPGRIRITVEIGADEITVLWADNGCGMSAEIRDQAFTPLFTTKETGSGLGLFITRAIVENHGGKICAESEPGGGTRFRISLPLYDLGRGAARGALHSEPLQPAVLS